jgi:hypothetical protein
MPDTIDQQLDLIRRTRRCRPEVRAAAAKLAHLRPEEYAELVRELIRTGEDTALGIVCNLCAVNGVRLEPDLAAKALRVIEPITDFGPLFRVQNKAAIAPLLKAAQDEELSIERQVYAALIAAEMSVLHKADPQPAQRVLHILEHDYSMNPMLEGMLGGALDLLQTSGADVEPETLLSQVDIMKLLPQQRPPVVIGDGHTVRRPIPKIGRNEPCPCGSGKKYKKCCLDKEPELLRDASPYAGLTMSQVRSSPQLVDDADFIESMRAYELKKLDPASLNPDQLLAAYRRAELFGLRELAFDMLLELEQRPDAHDFDKGHFVDLLESAMEAGHIELAKKIRAHVPSEIMAEPELTQLRFDLLENKQYLHELESLLCQEMTCDDTDLPDSPLLALSYGFEKTFPALSIVLARAYISANPDRMFDIQTLLKTVRRARAEIGIEAWEDPIEDYVEWSFARDLEEFREADRSEKLSKLIKDAEAARDETRAKEKELRQKEVELRSLSDHLEKQSKRTSPSPAPAPDSTPPVLPTAAEKETIQRLRQRIDRLKGEISAQQQIRRDLREELRMEREISHKRKEADQTETEPVGGERMADAEPAGRKILIPQYSTDFCRACEAVPPPVAAKALKSVTEFAAADETAWRRTRPIKRIDQCYRIRIGKNYRALIRWIPDKKIEALDLIPRKALETWIRNNC